MKRHNSQSASFTDFRHICGHYTVAYHIIFSMRELYHFSLQNLISLVELLLWMPIQK